MCLQCFQQGVGLVYATPVNTEVFYFVQVSALPHVLNASPWAVQEHFPHRFCMIWYTTQCLESCWAYTAFFALCSVDSRPICPV